MYDAGLGYNIFQHRFTPVLYSLEHAAVNLSMMHVEHDDEWNSASLSDEYTSAHSGVWTVASVSLMLRNCSSFILIFRERGRGRRGGKVTADSRRIEEMTPLLGPMVLRIALVRARLCETLCSNSKWCRRIMAIL